VDAHGCVHAVTGRDADTPSRLPAENRRTLPHRPDRFATSVTQVDGARRRGAGQDIAHFPYCPAYQKPISVCGENGAPERSRTVVHGRARREAPLLYLESPAEPDDAESPECSS